MKVRVLVAHCVQLFLIPWPITLCSWNSPGKNTGVGLPFPSPEDFPNPETEPWSPALQAYSLPFELLEKPHLMSLGKVNYLQVQFISVWQNIENCENKPYLHKFI